MARRPPDLPAYVGIAAKITTLHAALGQQSYPASQLHEALGLAPQCIAPALRLLGWQRTQLWDRTTQHKRRLRVWWTPPGGTPPRGPRGRPAIDIEAMLADLVLASEANK